MWDLQSICEGTGPANSSNRSRNMPMNLKRVLIELDVPDVERILSIDMDDDPAQALEFVKEILAKRVKESLQPH